MEKDHWIGIVVILGIIAIGLLGGAKNAQKNQQTTTTPFFSNSRSSNPPPAAGPYNPPDTNPKTPAQIQAEEDRKNHSLYTDIVHIHSVQQSTNPAQEYIIITMENSTSSVSVTGWRLVSRSSGNAVTIPQGTYLLFTNSENTKENIFLTGGDTLYLVTGTAANGESFKTNKCSGYLSQFQKFTPRIYPSCPVARKEDLSKIPTYPTNDECFDYIDSYPACKTQVDPLPITWSPECRNFITEKLTYSACILDHKNDKDFYKPEWRVYLKRSQILWKTQRESIVLYDNLGKVVDTYSY